MICGLAAILALGALVVCLPSHADAAGYLVPSASEASKEVVAVVEPFPNYVFHLLAVARVGFDSDYAARYRDTVPSDDLAVLERHRDLLAWGSGRTGALTSLFVFFPVYLNLERPDDCVEYYDKVASGAKSGSSTSFLERYSDAMERQRFWVAPGDFLSNPLGPAADHEDAVSELSRVFGRSYGTYLEKVWPREKTELDARATVLNRRFREGDLIGRWEALTGETFRFPRYEIVLVSAAAGGPSANSVGYERNVFYAEPKPESMVGFISHETGTHLLIDIFKEALSAAPPNDGRFFQAAYGAYECLNIFFNRMIQPDMEYGWSDYGEETFLSIYEGLGTAEPGIGARELFTRGLKAYLERIPRRTR